MAEQRQLYGLNENGRTPTEDVESHSLKRVFGDLCDKLDCRGLTPHLLGADLLTKGEYDEVEAEKTPLDKNKKLLSAVLIRSPTDIRKFCKLMYLYGQGHCGEILRKEFNQNGVDVTDLFPPPRSSPVITHDYPTYCPVIRKLKRPYGNLKRKVREIGMKTTDFRFMCQEVYFDFFDARGEVVEVTRDDFGDYTNDKALNKILELSDSIDCEVIEDLVTLIKEEELLKAWEEYKQVLKEEILTTLNQCDHGKCRQLIGDQMRMGFQTRLPPGQHTIEKILKLKKFLIDVIELDNTDFEGVHSSKVTVFFGVSKKHLPFLIRLLSAHRRILQDDFSVTAVFVPGQFVYDVDMDQEFLYPQKDSVSKHELDEEYRTLKENSHLSATRYNLKEPSTSSIPENSGNIERVPATSEEAQSLKILLIDMRKLVNEFQEEITRIKTAIPIPTSETQTVDNLQESLERSHEHKYQKPFELPTKPMYPLVGVSSLRTTESRSRLTSTAESFIKHQIKTGGTRHTKRPHPTL